MQDFGHNEEGDKVSCTVTVFSDGWETIKGYWDTIFWVKAMSSPDEIPQNDTSVDVQAEGLVVAAMQGGGCMGFKYINPGYANLLDTDGGATVEGNAYSRTGASLWQPEKSKGVALGEPPAEL